MKDFIEKSVTSLLKLAMLYAGRVSGVLVAVIFLPMYSRLLGSDQFGVVAVILSLQSLLIMMDLGMSSLISRDFAVAKTDRKELLSLIRTAEKALISFYFFLLITISIIEITWNFRNSGGFSVIFFSLIMFCVLVLQNLYYSALIASRHYSIASLIQVIGVGARAGVTAFVLFKYSSTLLAFVITQSLLACIHLFVTRYYFDLQIQVQVLKRPEIFFSDAIALVRKGKSLALFSLAGAAVTQLDKPIVSAFMSTSDVTPYFLATTLCMGSISVLASPISQFFQPKLLNAITENNEVKSEKVINHFVCVLFFVIFLPTIVLWTFREPIINLWVGIGQINVMIAHYVAILLPGVAIGLLGFIPYSLLITVKDFKFQARLSVVLTIVTLIFAAICANLKSVNGICFVYAAYNAGSTLFSWMRAMYLPSVKKLGRKSFIQTTYFLLVTVGLSIVFSYVFL